MKQMADRINRHVVAALRGNPYVCAEGTEWEEASNTCVLTLKGDDLECLDEVVTFAFLADIADVAKTRRIDFSDRDEHRGCRTCNHGGYGRVVIRIGLSDAKEVLP